MDGNMHYMLHRAPGNQIWCPQVPASWPSSEAPSKNIKRPLTSVIAHVPRMSRPLTSVIVAWPSGRGCSSWYSAVWPLSCAI